MYDPSYKGIVYHDNLESLERHLTNLRNFVNESVQSLHFKLAKRESFLILLVMGTLNSKCDSCHIFEVRFLGLHMNRSNVP